MKRRDFLKNTAILGVGAAIPASVRDVFAAADGPLVVQAKGGTPAQLARAVVAELGGMKAFVSPGETVVVKPNIGWDRKPEQAANTNPELVCEVVRMCLEAGAAKVKVFDRTCNDPRRCYVTSGIGPAVEAMNDPRVELSQVDERRFRKIDIPGATLLTSWPFYEDVLSADKYINVPIAKHHSAAVLTMGMKNILGVVGSNRAVLHRNLPEALLDLNRGLRTHLTIVDATRILTANGPQGGKLEDVTQLDTVVAGTDIVAVDSVACALFGKTPKDIRYLQMAHEQGFGVADLDRIRVKKIGV